MSKQVKAKSLKAGDEVVGVGVVHEAHISFPQIRVEYTSGKISYHSKDDILFITKVSKKCHV